MNRDFKIVKTVFMRGQKEGKKCMAKNKENEEKEKTTVDTLIFHRF